MTIAHEPSVYGCRICGATFVRGETVCLVIHPPGTCCHEHDKPFLKVFHDPNPTMFFLNSDKYKFKTVKTR